MASPLTRSTHDSTESTLVEVWAPWCSACTSLEEDLLTVAASRADRVRLERVNVASDGERAAELRVMATPTLIGFQNGIEVSRTTGRVSRTDLEELFDALAEGRRPVAPRRRTESVLAIGSGTAIAIGGVLMGPSPALTIIGIAVASVGILQAAWGWNANRS